MTATATMKATGEDDNNGDVDGGGDEGDGDGGNDELVSYQQNQHETQECDHIIICVGYEFNI